MRHGKYPQHGPRRRWWAPWKLICRCGLGAYPCYAMRMRAEQERARPRRVAPLWGGPTATMPRLFAPTDRDRPLLTPGQEARAESSWRRR